MEATERQKSNSHVTEATESKNNAMSKVQVIYFLQCDILKTEYHDLTVNTGLLYTYLIGWVIH